MKESAIVSKLSELPIEVLNDIRIAAAIARNANPEAPKYNKRHDALIENCNLALELKQAERLRGYTEDVEFSFV